MNDTDSKPKRKKIRSIFGENLKSIMEKRGLTHRQVAEICDVSVSVVGDWVGPTGSIPHDLQRVATLAQRLGVRFDWLLLGYATDTPEPKLSDMFDSEAEERLSGYFYIEARKLVPKGKK